MRDRPRVKSLTAGLPDNAPRGYALVAVIVGIQIRAIWGAVGIVIRAVAIGGIAVAAVKAAEAAGESVMALNPGEAVAVVHPTAEIANPAEVSHACKCASTPKVETTATKMSATATAHERAAAAMTTTAVTAT
jgi:hypothetical protein